MFTRNDGPLAFLTVIRVLATGDIGLLSMSARGESLSGAVEKLLASEGSVESKLLEVLNDYEATIPLEATRQGTAN